MQRVFGPNYAKQHRSFHQITSDSFCFVNEIQDDLNEDEAVGYEFDDNDAGEAGIASDEEDESEEGDNELANGPNFNLLDGMNLVNRLNAKDGIIFNCTGICFKYIFNWLKCRYGFVPVNIEDEVDTEKSGLWYKVDIILYDLICGIIGYEIQK